MKEIIIALTTTNSEREAKKLSHGLIERKLAACVNVISRVRSFYEWDGEIHDDTEHMLVIKAPRGNIDRVKEFIDRTHSYEVPEYVVLDVVDGLPDYLQWIDDVTA